MKNKGVKYESHFRESQHKNLDEKRPMFKQLKGNSLQTRRRTIKHRLFLHTLIYNSTFKLIDNLLLMYSFKSENLFSHLASSQVHRPWSPCDLKWRLFLEVSGGHPGTLLTFRQKSITSLWLFNTLNEWICFELKKYMREE